MEVHADNESNDSDKPKPKLLGEFLNDDDPPEVRRRYGQLPLMQSQHEKTEAEYLSTWSSIHSISAKSPGDHVASRGRVHIVRRVSAKLIFIVFREQITTIQGALYCSEGKISEAMTGWAEQIRLDTIVVKGK